MGFFELLWAYIVVAILAAIPFFEVVGVIPLGVVAGLHIVPVTLLALLGNVLTVLLVIILVNKVRNWLQRRKEKEETDSKRSRRARKIWGKYGLPGLTLLGPLFVGSHLTALMGISFGGKKIRVTYWMLASLVIWCRVSSLSRLAITVVTLGILSLVQMYGWVLVPLSILIGLIGCLIWYTLLEQRLMRKDYV